MNSYELGCQKLEHRVCAVGTQFGSKVVATVFVDKLIGRWWKAHRNLLSEADFKPPQAACIKSAGSER